MERPGVSRQRARHGWRVGWLLAATRISMGASGLEEYALHLWQLEDGLPQNAVSAVVQTSDGYLWVGTYNGLARFDGVRFTVFNRDRTPGLRNDRVTALFEWPHGMLVIGHETGELTSYQQGRFYPLDFQAAWSGRKIVGFAVDAERELWAVNGDGLLARVRDGAMQIPPAGQAVGLAGVVQGEQGRFWVLRDGQCSVYERGQLSAMHFDGLLDNRYVQGITPSRRGGLWVAEEGRLRRWSDGAWVEDLGAAPWGVSALTCFLETRSGLLAVGTAEMGLFVVEPGRAVRHWNRATGLPSDWVRCLTEDREGNLWFGIGTSGLAALRRSKAATVRPPDDWRGASVLSVSAGPEDEIYAGTEGAGIYRFHRGEWTHWGTGQGLSNLFVWTVCPEANGRVWAGTWGGGLFVRNGEEPFTRAPGTENLDTPITALWPRADGSLWVGTRAGLLHYDAGRLTWYGAAQGLALADVRAVCEDAQGRVWFGMLGGGLGCLENGVIRQFGVKDGLAGEFVLCLRADSDGSLWIGTQGRGLSRFRDGRFATVNSNHGLPSDVICHIADDGRGYFWISSHAGIFRVARAELNRCADGLVSTVNCLSYGRGDGLPTLECSSGAQPAGCQTRDGRLWFATSRGLAVVNPDRVWTNPLPPPVWIEALLVEGQPTELPPPVGVVQIPPGRRRLEFQFTGLSFVVPEKVRFKYRLEGLESEWLDAGAARKVNYSYVPPGKYTFRVIACNNDGVWNETGAQLALVVQPFFWETLGFRVALGSLALAAVAGGVWFETRRRLHRKLERAERQRAIERERSRIARDIHDDLGASLTRITMLCQTARADLHRPEQAAEDLDRIYGTARELTRALDEIVWAVNPRHDTLDSLANYLGRFAQDYLRPAGVRCRLDIPVHLPPWPLTAEVRHNLFLAFKEALNNVLKHAAATEVRLTLALEPNGFRLTVEDNGRGFAPTNFWTGGATEPDRAAAGN
ncbi:MAG: two-component regulator propeller domain-containing protein, partial [Verrucomicrobiales bacterium]|nr:two-component regulator propeller domain-containing protein [Verrucomicrobiales bacterium]